VTRAGKVGGDGMRRVPVEVGPGHSGTGQSRAPTSEYASRSSEARAAAAVGELADAEPPMAAD
jgi:hypothetical protein